MKRSKKAICGEEYNTDKSSLVDRRFLSKEAKRS